MSHERSVVEKLLELLIPALCGDQRRARAIWFTTIGPITKRPLTIDVSRTYMSDLLLIDDQKVEFSVEAVDDVGNPVPTPPTLTWASGDDTVVTVAAAPDGSTCEVSTTGKLGTVQVTVKDGSTPPIVGTVNIEVVAGSAASIRVVPGTPESRL